METRSAPRLDVIVAAPPRGHGGVAASAVNFRNQTGRLNREISNKLDAWCLLPQAVVPATPNEVVFKLSRHAVGGRTVTWLGLYRYATFPLNNRRNTYIGAGVLACEANPSVGEAVEYLTGLAASMIDGRGEFAGSAPDFAEQIGRQDLSLAPQPLWEGGLEANGREKFYADLTDVALEEIPGALTNLLEAGLTAFSFADGGELVVGIGSRLKRSAVASAAFTIVDRYGERDAPPPSSVSRVAHEKESQTGEVARKPVGKQVPQDWNWSPTGDEGAYKPEPLSLERLERRLRAVEAKDRGGDGGSGKKRTGGRYIWPIVSTALVLASLVGGAVGFKFYDDYRENATYAADVDLERGFEGQAAKVIDDGCPLADPADHSSENVALLKSELECRTAEVERLNDKIRLIETAISGSD